MAKSLRSKSKLRSKSLKRKGEFAKHAEARDQRLAERLAKRSELAEASKEKEPKTGEMDICAEEKKATKVSTSGWRSSHKQEYKKKKIKKNKTMKH